LTKFEADKAFFMLQCAPLSEIYSLNKSYIYQVIDEKPTTPYYTSLYRFPKLIIKNDAPI